MTGSSWSISTTPICLLKTIVHKFSVAQTRKMVIYLLILAVRANNWSQLSILSSKTLIGFAPGQASVKFF